MRRIDCADFLPGAIACKHVVEGETDEELTEAARAHACEAHPELDIDEDRLREVVRFSPA
jgi:predicted small metal-binding protein